MTIYVHKMPVWRSKIVAVLRLFTHLVRMIETVVALAARVETIRAFKIYDGKPLRRRRSNKIIRRTKQSESVIFSPRVISTPSSFCIQPQPGHFHVYRMT